MSIKIKEFLNKHFYRVFNESHLLYTAIYLVSAFFVGILSLIPGTGNIILFFASSISLTFIILLFIGIEPNMRENLFSEEGVFDRRKILSFLVVFAFCCVLLMIYFIFGKSSDLTIQFLGWDILLPTIFIIIFFGWNISQIWFLRYYMEDFASKAEDKLISNKLSNKAKERISLIFLIIALIIPIILNIISVIYFSVSFLNESTETFVTFIIIVILIFIIIGITSIRQIILHKKSKENSTPNIFSSIFYIIIWLYIWYRSFSFINAFSTASQTTTDLLTGFIDVVLMVAVAISVLRSLGGKIKGIQIFNQNNIAFFLYAFTLLYIEGQVLMLTGAGALKGIFSEAPQISLVNNFIILVVSVLFYIYYSSYILQRKGFINKTQFTPSEVVSILSQYRKYLESQGYIDLNRINQNEFETFLKTHNLSLKEETRNPEKKNKNTKEKMVQENGLEVEGEQPNEATQEIGVEDNVIEEDIKNKDKDISNSDS